VSIFWFCWAPYVALKLILLARPLPPPDRRWLDWLDMVCYSSQGILNAFAYGHFHSRDGALSVAFRADECQSPQSADDDDDDDDGGPVGGGDAAANGDALATWPRLYGRGADEEAAEPPPYRPLQGSDHERRTLGPADARAEVV